MLIRRALHRSLGQVRYVVPDRPRGADGLVAAVYGQVERDFGMLAPPVALHSPAPESLAASWLMLRESLVAAGTVDRADKEAVAAAVSLANSCPYCVAVHTTALHGQAAEDAAAAIAAGHPHAIPDPRRRAIALWATGALPGDSKGGRSNPEGASHGRHNEHERLAQAVERFPFGAEHLPQFLAVAVTFHYLNRMVSIFLDDSPVPSEVPAAARPVMMRLLGRIMRPAARRGPEAGLSLELLPAAMLPPDLGWAGSDPVIGDAFARAAAALDAAGRRTVPWPVQELVLARLARWDGAPPGLGRGWVAEAVSGLPPEQRSAARLALLTAFAAYQVSPSDIADFRRDTPGDGALIELTSWASMAAARRAGVLLAGSGQPVVAQDPPTT